MIAEHLINYQKIGDELYNRLRMLTFPLAVKFISDPETEIPDKSFRPSAFGKSMTLCQGFTLVRRSGATAAFTFDDNVCVASSLAHGWREYDPADLLRSQVLARYYCDETAQVKAGMTRKMMPQGKFKGMVISPLPKTRVEPDVILFYGNPTVMHHLITALSFHGRVISSNFYITGESCIKGLITPYLTGEPQVVIPGLGDRMNSMTGEDEMCMGVPAALLDELNENLFAAKMGQPVPFLLPDVPPNMTPAWPFLRQVLDKRK